MFCEKAGAGENLPSLLFPARLIRLAVFHFKHVGD